MANRSFLIATDTFASQINGRHELAEAAYGIPILWFGFFRLSDLQCDSQLSTAVENGSRQFAESLPIIKAMFGEYPVDDFSARLTKMVRAYKGKQLAMDFSEIESMDDPQPFQAKMKYALLSLAKQIPAPVGRSSLLSLSGLDITMPLPDHAFIGDLMGAE